MFLFVITICLKIFLNYFGRSWEHCIIITKIRELSTWADLQWSCNCRHWSWADLAGKRSLCALLIRGRWSENRTNQGSFPKENKHIAGLYFKNNNKKNPKPLQKTCFKLVRDANTAKDMHCNIHKFIEKGILCPKIAKDHIFRNADSQFAYHGQALPTF